MNKTYYIKNHVYKLKFLFLIKLDLVSYNYVLFCVPTLDVLYKHKILMHKLCG